MAIPYGLGGWVLVQVAEVILDAFEAPPWVMQGLLVVLVLGFPVAVVLAWVFDITPEHHVVRTRPLEELPDEADEEEEEQAGALSVEMGDSERRQVTILNAVFEMDHGDDPEADPEYQREFVTALKAVYQEAAERFEAYALPGGAEELTLVFGYPQAREDDARRAVSAGLDLIEKALTIPPPETDSAGLMARVGISTSLVVVEEEPDGQGATFIGQAPRMASWLQALAPQAAVLVGPYTRRLVDSHFGLEPAGSYQQTQFGDDVETFIVDAAVSMEDSFTTDVVLKGRDDEFHMLQERWENVVDGGGQFVVLRGEPGIGKSSMMSAFVRHVVDSGDVTLVPSQCSPHERDNPLVPVIRALQRYVLDITGEDSAAERLGKIESFLDRQTIEHERALALLAGLLSVDPGPEHELPGDSAQNIRIQTMELLLDLLSLRAARKPLLLVIEDLHWADPSTLEMIQMMVDRGPAAGLFVLFTARPGYDWDWTGRSYVLVHELLPISRRSSRTLIEEAAGDQALPEALVRRIIDETDGNPLFIQELTRAVLESDAWARSEAAGDADDFDWLEIPATLKDSLAARVDNLGEAKAVLQLCSVLGQEFSYDLLHKVSGTENETALKQGLADIVGAELLYQRGVLRNLTYKFKHILILETAYNSLLKSKRRELHARTAEILEQESDGPAKTQPAQLAYHYSEAGQAEKAIPYWTLASKHSLDTFANSEAMEQARRGIALLESLPDSPQRASAELPLQIILGKALLTTHGYADPRVQEVFTRAQDLCEQIGDAPQLFPIVVGLWMYYIIASELSEAFEQAQRLQRIAETTGNPAHELQARYCQAFVLYYKAEFLAARTHLEAAMVSEVDDCDYAAQSASGDDTRLHVRVLLALVDWHLGCPRTSLQLIREANAIAKKAGHPWGQTFAAFYSAWFHQMRLDSAKTLEYANEAARIAEEKGFRFWMPLVGYMRAWAGNREAGSVTRPLDAGGVEKMTQALALYRGVGAGMGVTYLAFKIAEDRIALGLLDEAAADLEQGWQARQSTGEDFFEPEYYRLQGRIRLRQFRDSGEPGLLDDAEKHFREALGSAHRIESKGLELRAASDLATVLAERGQAGEGIRNLEGVLKRFEETDDSDLFVTVRKRIKNYNKESAEAE